MRIKDILLATLVSIVWGGSYIAVKYTVMEIPGLLSIAIRYLMVFSMLLPFVQRPSRANFKDLYAISLVIGVFCHGLLYYGASLGLDANLAVIVMQLSIPFSIVIARFSLKEYITPSSAMGVIISFAGMLVVVGAPNFNGRFVAFILVFFSAFFLAVYSIQSKKLKAIPPLSLLCWSNLIAAPHLFIISYFLEGNPLDLIEAGTFRLWVSLLYLVIFSSIIGMWAWVHLLRIYSINKVDPFNLLVPCFGVSLSSLILDEVMSWYIIVGTIVTVVGIALSQMKSLPFLKNKEV